MVVRSASGMLNFQNRPSIKEEPHKVIDLTQDTPREPSDTELLNKFVFSIGPGHTERYPINLSEALRQELVALLRQWEEVKDPYGRSWDRPSPREDRWICINSARISDDAFKPWRTNGYACKNCFRQRRFCIRARAGDKKPLLVPLDPVNGGYGDATRDRSFWIRTETPKPQQIVTYGQNIVDYSGYQPAVQQSAFMPSSWSSRYDLNAL